MITYIKKNERLKNGDKIECYYSERKHSLSIRTLNFQSEYFNRIIAYADAVHLTDAEFLYRGGRIIVRGYFAGSLPIAPKTEKMVVENNGNFYDLNGSFVNAANYCVCYLNMILAEGCFIKYDKNKSNLL